MVKKTPLQTLEACRVQELPYNIPTGSSDYPTQPCTPVCMHWPLVFIFVLSFLVEWLSHCKLIRSGIFQTCPRRPSCMLSELVLLIFFFA
ncbi:hypothetical protein Q3G72_034477 [Acer saccharum]|nr:hypothetical protein Q3G72_034477 [Acer saccharum]